MVNGDQILDKSVATGKLVDGDKIAALLSAPPASGPKFVDGEVPQGALDGANAVFTLANTPAAGSLQLFLNGVLQSVSKGEYALAGAQVTFKVAPDATSEVLAFYRL